MRHAIRSLLLLAALAAGSRAWAFNPGDVAFTAFNSAGSGPLPKSFSFVVLQDFSAGSVLYFTNTAWGTTTALGAGSKVVSVSANSDIPAGTVITYVQGSGPGTVDNPNASVAMTLGSGGLGIKTTAGLDLTAFQGTTTSPVAITALVDGENWGGSFPLPGGLTDGTNAWHNLAYFSGGYYNCSTVLGASS
ncbi:MAG TPA: hypothetical protein VK842_03815, partial [bacterium]|nr:hypothetical protein [bacterium]